MKAALVQFAGRANKELNIERGAHLALEAIERGAEVVCFHELMSTIYFAHEESNKHFPLAEPIPGPATQVFCELARRHRVVFIVPIFEAVNATTFYNSAAVIDSTGEILGTYRKSAIPHIRRDGVDPTGFEKYYFKPGDNGLPVFQTAAGWKLGVLICFDRHFPEHFRALALGGADVIFVPTTAPFGGGPDAWFFELQAAAFSNNCFVAGVNRVGLDEGGSPRPWPGTSVVVDPAGAIVAQASGSEDEVLVTDLSVAEVAAARARWGFFRDRRPDIYSRLVE